MLVVPQNRMKPFCDKCKKNIHKNQIAKIGDSFTMIPFFSSLKLTSCAPLVWSCCTCPKSIWRTILRIQTMRWLWCQQTAAHAFFSEINWFHFVYRASPKSSGFLLICRLFDINCIKMTQQLQTYFCDSPDSKMFENNWVLSLELCSV